MKLKFRYTKADREELELIKGAAANLILTIARDLSGHPYQFWWRRFKIGILVWYMRLYLHFQDPPQVNAAQREDELHELKTPIHRN